MVILLFYLTASLPESCSGEYRVLGWPSHAVLQLGIYTLVFVWISGVIAVWCSVSVVLGSIVSINWCSLFTLSVIFSFSTVSSHDSVADPGEGPGGPPPPPLILDQTEPQRAEKLFWETHPLSKGLDDFPPPYRKFWIRRCALCFIWCTWSASLCSVTSVNSLLVLWVFHRSNSLFL